MPNPDLAKLIRKARRGGAKVEPDGKGNVTLYGIDGRSVKVNTSRSRDLNMAETRKRFRDAGLDV